MASSSRFPQAAAFALPQCAMFASLWHRPDSQSVRLRESGLQMGGLYPCSQACQTESTLLSVALLAFLWHQLLNFIDVGKNHVVQISLF